jgi:ubiquinone/menaquinone biosynthesis C-methylase UbiE
VVVDLGAGSGYYTFALAQAVGPRGTVLAVEIQEEMLAALRSRAAQANATNVGLIRGRADDPRLPAGRVDLVLMVDVYHELEFPYEVMTKVAQSLKASGRVALIEYRAEDPDLPIRSVHKMTEAQMRLEMAAVGLVHVRTVDTLPWQHLVLFSPKPEAPEPRSRSPKPIAPSSASSSHRRAPPPPSPPGGGTPSAVIVTEDCVVPPAPVHSSV